MVVSRSVGCDGLIEAAWLAVDWWLAPSIDQGFVRVVVLVVVVLVVVVLVSGGPSGGRASGGPPRRPLALPASVLRSQSVRFPGRPTSD